MLKLEPFPLESTESRMLNHHRHCSTSSWRSYQCHKVPTGQKGSVSEKGFKKSLYGDN